MIAPDIEATAQKVAAQSFSLAKAMGADIVLLHVISDSSTKPSSERITIVGFNGRKNNMSNQAEGMGEFKNTSSPQLDKPISCKGDFSIKMMVQEADFTESILKAAQDLHAELLFWAQTDRDVVKIT